MIVKEKYTLSNGVEIPKIGLGTWRVSDGSVAQAVKDATAIGYRHIDTAQAYGNERGVGEGIRSCGVPRDEIFVTTKVTAEIKSYTKAASSIDRSLKAMGLDYIDMIIIHSPQPWSEFGSENRYCKGNIEVWHALEDAYKAGKLRAIGVSNFEIDDLENIFKDCSINPMVNQVLAHIGNTPKELIAYCRQRNILTEAYSPIAHGELLENRDVLRVAEKYGVSVPQLAIRYCLELGLLPLPKTANPKNMSNNAAVDFTISAEDLDILKNIQPISYGAAKAFPVYNIKRN